MDGFVFYLMGLDKNKEQPSMMLNDLKYNDFFDELDDCLLLKDLRIKIDKRKLKVGVSLTSDWLKTLSDLELDYIIRMFNVMIPCSGQEDMDACDGDCEACEISSILEIDNIEEINEDVLEILFVIYVLLDMESGVNKYYNKLSDDDIIICLALLREFVAVDMYRRCEEGSCDELGLINGMKNVILKLEGDNEFRTSKNQLSKGLMEFFDSKSEN